MPRRPKKKDGVEGALQALQELQGEAAKIAEGVKAELLERIHADVASLKRLGFFYSLVAVAKKERGKAAERKAEWRAKLRSGNTQAGPRRDGQRHGTITDAPCKICGFKTQPLHDGRIHLHNQTNKQKKVRPFTAKELTDLGLTRVE